MKQMPFLILCFALLLILAGCGKAPPTVSDAQGNADAGAPEPATAGQEAPAFTIAPQDGMQFSDRSPATSMDELKERFPEYFDLSTFKGLEVYVWQLAPENYLFGVMEGTNRNKTDEELWSLKGATLDEMRAILSTYDIPKENIFVMPIRQPYSSYLYAIDEAYAARVRELLLGDKAAVTRVAYANYTEDSRIFSCLNAEKLAISSVQHLPVFKFDTKEDLDRFKDTFRDSFTFDHGYDEMPSFNEVTAGYDESFFAEMTVILAYVPASSGSFRFDIQEVVFSGAALCLNVVQINRPEAYTADMSGWFVIAEVLDEVVVGCTEFDAKIVELEDPVGKLFDEIMSSPSWSSIPGDYIRAHEEAHQQLLADPKATLQYIFAEFLHAQRTGSGQTGLKGHVMLTLLSEIAPEEMPDMTAVTSQDYFDAWMSQAEGLREQHGDEWMEDHRPAMRLLLQMAE